MAGKRQNAKDNWLPPRVYLKGPSYVFRPKNGGSIRLCSAKEARSVVWAEYEKMQAEIGKGNISRLVSQFFESADFADLSKATQGDYRKYSKPILKVFGLMDPDKVEPQHVRAYMDKRGKASRVQANREKAFFSRVFRWAYERGKVKKNPCQGVRQFKEKARDRYVTDLEYQAVYDAARPAVRVAMELSYLCAARKGDVLKLRWSSVLEEGIFIQQGKTGAKQIKAWSPRLRAIITQAKNLSKNALGTYVVIKPDGMPYTDNGFNAAWRTAVLNAREKTGWPLDFTFHDLKAKAISDIAGSSKDKQAISGHKTEGQVAVYDRSIKVVPAVDSVKKQS
ncbi:tyrosine-type recombinase/integrase [Oceanimonas smirnovii]|uniref:tyrosine-type recombinase/integrase n=1 Tax=Oceanimonas smirnovii TaxID=264574 RepID=UPI003FD278BC